MLLCLCPGWRMVSLAKFMCEAVGTKMILNVYLLKLCYTVCALR